MGRLATASLAVIALILGNVAAGADTTTELRVSDFRVSVQIDGIGTAYFRSVSGLKVQQEVIEYREGGDNGTIRKLIGVTKWPNLVLKQGFVGAPSPLQRWAFRNAGGAGERHNGRIVVYDDKMQPVASWSFVNAFPVKWEGPDFDAGKNEIAVETIEIAHEGLRLD